MQCKMCGSLNTETVDADKFAKLTQNHVSAGIIPQRQSRLNKH